MDIRSDARTRDAKSIQRIQISVATGVGIVTATGAITTVNPALTEIWDLGCVYGAGNSTAPSYAVDLLDSTTVAVYSRSPGSTNTVYVQVTEHN